MPLILSVRLLVSESLYLLSGRLCGCVSAHASVAVCFGSVLSSLTILLLSVCLCIFQSYRLQSFRSISVYFFPSVSVYVYVCLSVYLSLCLSLVTVCTCIGLGIIYEVSFKVFMSFIMSVSLCISQSVHQHWCPFLCFQSVCARVCVCLGYGSMY